MTRNERYTIVIMMFNVLEWPLPVYPYLYSTHYTFISTGILPKCDSPSFGFKCDSWTLRSNNFSVTLSFTEQFGRAAWEGSVLIPVMDVPKKRTSIEAVEVNL